VLVVMLSADRPESEETIVNPNLIDPSGALSIDWFVPSPDGKLVAVSMSSSGTEVGDLYIFPVEIPTAKAFKERKKNNARKPQPGNADEAPEEKQREPVDIRIPRVNAPTAGGDLAWTLDSKGFYYTRYPNESEQIEQDLFCCQQLYYHKLGNPLSEDRRELGPKLDPIAQIRVSVDSRSGRVLARVRQGDGHRYSHYLRVKQGKWQQLTWCDDGVVDVEFAPGGGMFLLSRKEAPRGRILFLPSPKMPVDKARKVVPESSDSIASESLDGQSLLVTESMLYVTYQLGGPSEIRAFDHRGEPKESPVVPSGTGIGHDLVALDQDEILFSVHSYTEPKAFYTYTAMLGGSSTDRKPISTNYGVNFQDVEVIRSTVNTPDGAQVPLTIVHRRDLPKNRDNPTILVGYGSMGIPLTPELDPTARIWLDHGGVLAYAHVRGGGELGDGWHRAGALAHKQHAFDDFYACANYLISSKLTSKRRLALMGIGAGGLLMGAVITQHPDIARAVVTESGLFDMLRAETTPKGKFEVPEFGSTQEKSELEVLYAYSPYHNVKDKTGYPAVLLITGKNNIRMSPFHSFKMAARLQSATSNTNPILVKINPDAGRLDAMPYLERLRLKAEVLAFLFDQLDISYRD
jgi:prolyl oligopeptidase